MAVAAGPDIVEDGLVFYVDAANEKSYPGSGTTWYDISGAGIEGTINESPTYSSDYQGRFTFNSSNLQWVQFNTSGKEVSVGQGNTLCCFLYRTSTTTAQRNIISTRFGGGGGALYIGSRSNQIFSYYNTLSPASYVATTFPNNTFLYIVVRLNTDSTITHFSKGDGIDDKNTCSTKSGTWNSGNNNQLRFGGDLEYFDGDMYLYQHYNRALTDAEVQQNYVAVKSRFGL